MSACGTNPAESSADLSELLKDGITFRELSVTAAAASRQLASLTATQAECKRSPAVDGHGLSKFQQDVYRAARARLWSDEMAAVIAANVEELPVEGGEQ